MIIREKTFGQNRKSSGETASRIVHNAVATEKEEKTNNATCYVNICNHSTPDIGEKGQVTTIYCFGVNIKYRIFLRKI